MAIKFHTTHKTLTANSLIFRKYCTNEPSFDDNTGTSARFNFEGKSGVDQAWFVV